MASSIRLVTYNIHKCRGLDGRIDDPNAGWKGRGLWMTYSSYLPRFTETRRGTVNHMQIRPNPLAN